MATFAKPPCDEASILAQPCAEPSAANGGWVLATTILGSSMAFIDGTVVNVALPALQSALGATLSQVQWVVKPMRSFSRRCCSSAALWEISTAAERYSLPGSRSFAQPRPGADWPSIFGS